MKPRPNKTAAGRLAAGKEPFWSRSRRPRRVAVEAETGVPDPEEPVVDGRSAIAAVLSVVAILLTLVAVLSVVIWLAIGLTVMPTPRVAGDIWAVKWAAWPQGQVPPGSIVMSTPEQVSGDLSSRFGLLLADGEGATLSQIVGGPTGSVETTQSLQILINGQDTGYRSPSPISKQNIGDQYVAICLKGCSADGVIHLIPIGNVVGEVMGRYKFPLEITPMPSVSSTPSAGTPSTDTTAPTPSASPVVGGDQPQ